MYPHIQTNNISILKKGKVRLHSSFLSSSLPASCLHRCLPFFASPLPLRFLLLSFHFIPPLLPLPLPIFSSLSLLSLSLSLRGDRKWMDVKNVTSHSNDRQEIEVVARDTRERRKKERKKERKKKKRSPYRRALHQQSKESSVLKRACSQ